MKKVLSTKIDEKLFENFKEKCLLEDLKQSDVISALLQFYIDNNIEFEKKIEIRYNAKKD